MKVVLISMPDVVPVIIHEMALHLPNHAIACVGGNVDEPHEVFLIDLVRKRGNVAGYLRKALKRIRPGLVGLSAMTWQYQSCLALINLIREIVPGVKIAVGGYHATLMSQEMAAESDPVDFMVRGEGEETFRRLVNALDGTDHVEAIPGLSFKLEGKWVHNERSSLCDLSKLKLPIRDKRRLTGGYHFMYYRMETMETSRGCTRNCNFCSINHMYGRSYRTYPIERIIADMNDIYYNNKTKMIFITDDNMVLSPKWVMEFCDGVIRQKYRNLNLVVQADCMSMAKNEPMVKKMAEAGFRAVFLGIENASEENLRTMHKSDVIVTARQAVENCHKNGIMVVAGLIFGLPNDNEASVVRNYTFLKELQADASYCQMLCPYPKTPLRDLLIEQGLVTNCDRYERYNGMWANVRTNHLSAEQLQYYFWYHRQVTLGWWKPSWFAKRHGQAWTSLWMFAVKPVMKFFYDRRVRKKGWEDRYRADIRRLEQMNNFEDLRPYTPKREPDDPGFLKTGSGRQ